MPYPRKPTKIKIAEGNRGKRRLLPEPQPLSGAPCMPDRLDEDAREMWERIVPELERLGLLSQVDGGALEGVCTAYSRAVSAGRIIKAEGLTMRVGEGGYLQQRPEVSIEMKAWAQFRAFCNEFGLTPAARTRLASDPKCKTIDPIETALLQPSKSEIECGAVQ